MAPYPRFDHVYDRLQSARFSRADREKWDTEINGQGNSVSTGRVVEMVVICRASSRTRRVFGRVDLLRLGSEQRNGVNRGSSIHT